MAEGKRAGKGALSVATVVCFTRDADATVICKGIRGRYERSRGCSRYLVRDGASTHTVRPQGMLFRVQEA